MLRGCIFFFRFGVMFLKANGIYNAVADLFCYKTENRSAACGRQRRLKGNVLLEEKSSTVNLQSTQKLDLNDVANRLWALRARWWPGHCWPPPMDALVSVCGAGCVCGVWPGLQALLHLTPQPSSMSAQLSCCEGRARRGPAGLAAGKYNTVAELA